MAKEMTSELRYKDGTPMRKYNSPKLQEIEMGNEKQYWNCEIGPVYRKEIPDGGDGPLRAAVQNKFIEMFGEQAEICGSGWGLTEEMKTRLDIISLLPSLPGGTEALKQIDEILSKR